MSGKKYFCVCDECKHNQVCKYKDEFQIKSQKIYDLIESNEQEDPRKIPIKIDIGCEYFQNTESITAPPGVSPLPWPGTPLPTPDPWGPGITPTSPNPYFPYPIITCDTSKTNKTE